MKARPYRKCDICGREYYKNKSMRVKVASQAYDQLFAHFDTIDICPKCGEELIRHMKWMLGKCESCRYYDSTLWGWHCQNCRGGNEYEEIEQDDKD